MAIGNVVLDPSEVTVLINLVFVGWLILAFLGQVYRSFDLIEDLSLAILIILVGLRYALLGMLEQDLVKAFLVIPLVSAALRILKAKLGKWRTAS